MSNYIYTNEGLVNADELMHYGVPGMRWGHRKTGFVSTTKYRPKGPNSGGLYDKHKLKGPNSGGIDNPRKPSHKGAKYAGVSTDGSKRRAAEKARQELISAKQNKRAKQKAFDKAYNESNKIKNWFGERGEKAGAAAERAANASNRADKQYKSAKKAYKAAKKMANIEAKAVKQKYKDEYMKGASIVGKIYAKLTDAHKYYADVQYNINNGSYKPSSKR